MDAYTVIAIAIGWIVCGVLSAGIDVAYFQQKFPSLASYRKDLGFALLMGLIFGPIALMVSFFTSGFCEHGWYLRYREPKP
jgi:hypothetical protein